jgi:uncharacterized membrane protein YagU involved in acid resistance
MIRRDTPIEVALKGASAGLVGTLVLTVAMRATAKLLESPIRSGPGGGEPDQANTEPPAILVRKLAGGLFERELTPAVQNALGQILHWGYGALWGLVYGIVQGSIGFPAALHGTVLGLILWLVGPLGLVPAMKISPMDAQRESPRLIRSLIFHQVYGWAVALAFSLFSRDD